MVLFLLIFNIRLLLQLKKVTFFLNSNCLYFEKMLYLCAVFWTYKQV